MNRFDGFVRWAWSMFIVFTLALAMSGCEGDDGQDGATGPAGPAGPVGPAGPPGPVPDAIAAAIDSAQIESCGTCHGDAGGDHQGIYDQYSDASTFGLTFDNLGVVAAAGGGFDLTLDFSITQDGQPYIDPVGSPPSVDSTSFYIVEYDSVTGEFYNSAGGFAFGLSAANAASNGDGTYTLTQNVSVDPTAFAGGAIMGRIANGLLDIEDDQYNPAAGKRVQMYADLAGASWPIGDVGTYVSAANVEACEACHGAPYRKHGNSPGMVAGVPEFTYCRGCHNNTAAGGHPEWQHMVDDPLAWATGLDPTAEQTARYGYERTLQQDVHMSHALEFPYPQSMANCATCHEGNLAQILDNSNFQTETCQGCHVIEGIDAWPDETYEQPHRAPAFSYLWQRGADLTFHETLVDPDCTACHGNPGVGAPEFADYHTGYDGHIYDAAGVRYADTYTVSIDSVSMAGDLMTVEFSSSDPAVVPELLVSFYGWDTKDFLVGSHERDANPVCTGFRPGCKMEYVPESSGGGANPLFTEDAASVPGAWIVTLDVSALQLTKTDLLPDLIANGDVTKAEVSITPELELGGEDVVLEAVSDTFDIASNSIISDYFAGANAIVDIAKCNACHDTLASTFHAGSGRGGDGMQVCRACHTTTFPGSHVEMASRSIDSYVHAIHSFQAFDPGDTFETFDPVEARRYDLHVGHALPYFTALACEACHNPGTYDAPDQSKSMPGVASTSDDVATWYGFDAVTGGAIEDTAGRNIGTVPEYVTGPASRACGACHRADLINADAAGDLATFNAHTEAFGTLAENDSDDMVVFGIIDKIMTLFE